LERVLSHARLGLEQRIAEGRAVDRQLIDSVAQAAGEVASARREAAWGRWALSIYASLGLVPPASLIAQLVGLPSAELLLLAPAAQRVLDSVAARGGESTDELAGLQALSQLLGSPVS